MPPLEKRVPETKRILVTRAAHQAGKLSEGLRAAGFEPVEVPVLEIRPPESFEPLDRALRKLDLYNWLIFTSANTVRAFVERSAALGISFAKTSALQVAAVGAATATAARDAGIQVALVPETYVAESLVDEFRSFVSGHDPGAHSVSGARVEKPIKTVLPHPFAPFAKGWEDAEAGLKGHGLPGSPATGPRRRGDLSRAKKDQKTSGALAPEASFRGKRILLARAAVARDVIPDALRAAGATVDVVDAYRNVMPETAPHLLRQALAAGIDAATFTSSSSVTHLAEAAKAAGISFPFAGVRAVSIGPITSQTLRESGWEPAIEAAPHDIPGLIAAVQRILR